MCSKPYTFIDLFAGIGGFHLAMHAQGARCVFASEWDRFARQTYEANYSKIAPELFRNGLFAGDINEVPLCKELAYQVPERTESAVQGLQGSY